MIDTGDLVSFLNIKNARGYPATGEVLVVIGDGCSVEAWGLYGPGSITIVNDVPLNELKVERKKTTGEASHANKDCASNDG